MNIHLKLIMTMCVAMTVFSPIDAQEDKKSKKVVIIKKIDDNGNVTETRTEAEGAEADALLKSFSPDDLRTIDIENDGNNKKVIKITKNIVEKEVISNERNSDHKEIEISSDIINGKTIERYKIIKKDGDNEQVIEWNGEGQMPEELAKELENIDLSKKDSHFKFFIDSDDIENDEEVVIIQNESKKGDKSMKWNDRQGKRFMKEGDQNGRKSYPNMTKERKFMYNTDRPNTNKVSLGVVIDDTDNGVTITEIVPASAAEQAGLRRGDILLKINDTYIFTSNGLLDTLNPFNPNEKVKIRYIRDGKEKSVKATLKARKG